MIKACIFDLDGTLTDTIDSLAYSVGETLKEMGLKPITKAQCQSFVRRWRYTGEYLTKTVHIM